MSEFIKTLLNMSITASVIALVVMLLRLVFKRIAPKRVIVLLWVLVAVRLVCPVSIESNLALMPKDPAQSIPVIGSTVGNEGFDAQRKAEHADNSGDFALTESEQNPTDEVGRLQENKKTTTVPNAGETAFVIWAAGAFSMLVYMIVSYVLLNRQVRVSMRLENAVYLADGIDTSFILGLFNPRIYVPSELSECERAYVLSHERRHISRLDHLWKPFGFILLALNWFNPVLWVAYVLLCRDIELACDEAVISGFDVDARKEYSTVLLKCSIKRKFITACPIAFGETGVKERVNAMKNYKKPAIIIIIAVIAAGAVCAAVLLTSPKTKKTNTDVRASDTSGSTQTAYNTPSSQGDFSDALPLDEGDVLLTDWSYAQCYVDIDNDGIIDRVTYTCLVGGDGELSEFITEFGGTGKIPPVKQVFEWGLTHPEMTITKYGDDNIIWLYEESQGSEPFELVYVFKCNTVGEIKTYDDREVTSVMDANINSNPVFLTNVGTFTLHKNGDAKVTFKGTENKLKVSIPTDVFESVNSTKGYTGDYYPRLIQTEDSIAISEKQNVIKFELHASVCFRPNNYNEILCTPALATLFLEYTGNDFIVQKLVFTEIFDWLNEYGIQPTDTPSPAESAKPTESNKPKESAKPTPSPSAKATPSPTPSATPTQTREVHKYDEPGTRKIDLDGDGRKEIIKLYSTVTYFDPVQPDLGCLIYSSDEKECLYNSYDYTAVVSLTSAHAVWVADISGDGRLAVFVAYNRQEMRNVYGFFITDHGVEYIKCDLFEKGGLCMGDGIRSIKDGKISIYENRNLLGTFCYRRTGVYDAEKNMMVFAKKAQRAFDTGGYSPKLHAKLYGKDESGNEVKLPANRGYQPIESDFGTYAVLQDDQGNKYRVEIKPNGLYSFLINGVDQEELFYGVY